MNVSPMNPATECQPNVSESGKTSQQTASIWQKWSVAVGEKAQGNITFFTSEHFYNASRVMYEALVKEDLQARKPRDLWAKFRQDVFQNYSLMKTLGFKTGEVGNNPLLGHCTRRTVHTYPIFEFAASSGYLSNKQVNQILSFGDLQLEQKPVQQESIEIAGDTVASSGNVQPCYYTDPGSAIPWRTVGEKLKDGSKEFYLSDFFIETADILSQSIPDDIVKDFNTWFLNSRKKSIELKLGSGEIEKLDSIFKVIEKFKRGHKHLTALLELLDKAGLLPEVILENCRKILAG